MRYMILDFNNVLHMAHIPATQKNPGPDNNMVIRNFLGMLSKYIRIHEIGSLIVCIEGVPLHRQEVMGEEYKAGRQQKTTFKWEQFKRQMRLLQSMLTKLIPCVVIRHNNLEADDSIYEAAMILGNEVEGAEDILICSSDRDLIQILQEDTKVPIRLWSPQQKDFRECPEVAYLPMKALQGDKSDNIDGVQGIGPKKSERIVREGIDKWLEENPEYQELYDRNIGLMELRRWAEIPGECMVSPSLWRFSKSRFNVMMESIGIGIGNDIGWMTPSFERLRVSRAFVAAISVQAVSGVEDKDTTDS